MKVIQTLTRAQVEEMFPNVELERLEEVFHDEEEAFGFALVNSREAGIRVVTVTSNGDPEFFWDDDDGWGEVPENVE